MLRRSGGPLTGFDGRTTASILFLNPTALPPESSFYGAVSTRGFRLSTCWYFGGKPWQLRTVIVANEHRIVPFVINSGGIESCAPIIGTPMLEKIGVLSKDAHRAGWSNQVGSGAPDGRQSVHLTIPSPLGELTAVSDWDDTRARSVDVRYNLIGHGFAVFIRDFESFARLVLGGRLTFQAGVDDLMKNCPKEIKKYIHANNRKRVERELTAMIESVHDEDDRGMDKVAKAWAEDRRL